METTTRFLERICKNRSAVIHDVIAGKRVTSHAVMPSEYMPLGAQRETVAMVVRRTNLLRVVIGPLQCALSDVWLRWLDVGVFSITRMISVQHARGLRLFVSFAQELLYKTDMHLKACRTFCPLFARRRLTRDILKTKKISDIYQYLPTV